MQASAQQVNGRDGALRRPKRVDAKLCLRAAYLLHASDTAARRPYLLPAPRISEIRLRAVVA